MRLVKLMLSDDVATHDGLPVVNEVWSMVPPVEVARVVRAVAVVPPSTMVPSDAEVRPVPPPATLRVPEVDGVRVKVVPEFVSVLPKVRPLNDWVEVPMVMAPVCAEPKVCWKEETPLLIDEVDTHVGTPRTRAST